MSKREDKVLSVVGYDALKTDAWPAMILRFNRQPSAEEMRDIYSTVGGWLCGQWHVREGDG